MELSEVIQKRYSVRGYKPDPVEEEKLHTIKESLHHMEEEVLKRLWEVDRQRSD